MRLGASASYLFSFLAVALVAGLVVAAVVSSAFGIIVFSITLILLAAIYLYRVAIAPDIRRMGRHH